MNTLPAREQRNLERRMYRRAAQQGQMLVKSRRTGERGLYVLVDDTMGTGSAVVAARLRSPSSLTATE